MAESTASHVDFPIVKPYLLGFMASTVLYFVVLIPMSHQTIFGVLLKILPLLALITMVLDHGLRRENSYGSMILVGLILFVFGDTMIDFPNYFIHGLIFYKLALLSYTTAFGLTPRRYSILLAVVLSFSPPLYFIAPALLTLGTIQFFIWAYCLMVKIMIWRAITAVLSFKGRSKKLFVLIGIFSYSVFDGIWGINYINPIPYAQIIMMIGYYLTHLTFALSTLINLQIKEK